jgi:hypothetical protein
MKKDILEIHPAPDRVLIKITDEQIESLTSRCIVRDDGTKVKLFTRPAYSKGFDQKFTQNVSIGTALAVGELVTKIVPGDLCIVDYLVTNDLDVFVGYFRNSLVAAVKADTILHEDDATPAHNGRRAWVKGDYDTISPILGVIRDNEIVAFDPYIFLEIKKDVIIKVLANGKLVETPDPIATRTVIAAPVNYALNPGDEIITKSESLFGRYINNKELSVIFKDDVLIKKMVIK